MNATTKSDTTDDATADQVRDAEPEDIAAEDTTAGDIAAEEAADDATAEEEAEDTDPADASGADRSRIGAGAAAVVAAALGFVALSGSWMGNVLSERETLTGQLKLPQGASTAQQIHEVYGDSWHTTALVNGVFALLALVVGLVVLALPSFGTPGRSQAVWVRAVAWGAVAIAVIGVLISLGMYFDLFASLPSAPVGAPTATQ